MTTVRLSPPELEKCIEFSVKSANTQQEIEYGDPETAPRSRAEIAKDNLIGKISEVAFARMMKRDFGIIVPLDFEYYPRGVWDKEDALLNNWKIDVKGTRYGNWLLIEWNKLRFRKKEGALSDLYVMAKVGWDQETNSPNRYVKLVGSAKLNSLQHGIPTTLILPKDDLIPGTTTKLQTNNFGIHFDHLDSDWNNVVDWIMKNPPQDTIGFQVPN